MEGVVCRTASRCRGSVAYAVQRMGASHKLKAEYLSCPLLPITSHLPTRDGPGTEEAWKAGCRIFGIEMYIDACRRMKFVVVKSVLAMMMAVDV